MLQKVKRSLQVKEHKRLLDNFLSLSAMQAAGVVLPFLTLPYVLRVLGVTNYGWIVLANSLILYFTSVTDYSFKVTATRDVVVHRNSQKKLNLIYSRVIVVKALLLAVSMTFICAVVFLYEPFYQERLIFFLTLPMLAGHAIFPEWFFQGMEDLKHMVYLNIGIKAFFTAGVFLFISAEQDYWIYPLLQSLGFLCAGIIAQFILASKYKVRFVWVGRKRIIATLKSNYPIFMNQFLPNLYNNTSTFLLGILTSASLVGIYDAIKKVCDLNVSLLNLVSRVFYPFLNRRKSAFPMYRKLMLLLGITLAVMPVILSRWIFWFLNISHPQALPVLLVLCIGVFFYVLYDIYGINYFIILREDRVVMSNTFIASLVGLVLAFPLIHLWGFMGAAINLTIARGIMGLGLYRKFLKTDANESCYT